MHWAEAAIEHMLKYRGGKDEGQINQDEESNQQLSWRSFTILPLHQRGCLRYLSVWEARHNVS